MTTLSGESLIRPKSTDKLDEAISKISKLSEHSQVGDDNIYSSATSAPPSTMHKINMVQQVKHSNNNALNNAFNNAINDEQSKGFVPFDNTYSGNINNTTPLLEHNPETTMQYKPQQPSLTQSQSTTQTHTKKRVKKKSGN